MFVCVWIMWLIWCEWWYLLKTLLIWLWQVRVLITFPVDVLIVGLWLSDKTRFWNVNGRKICLKSWAPLSSWTSFLQTLPFRPSVILLRPTEVSSTKRRSKTGRKKVEGKEEAKNGAKAGKNGAKRGIEHKTTGYRTGTKRVCVCEAQNSNPIHK